MRGKALLVALVLAAAGATLLWLYKQRFEKETVGGERIAIVVATGPIELGTKITPAKLALRTLPERYVEGRHILAKDLERIVGLRVRSSVKASESVLWSDLAATGEGARDLAAMVPHGMVAISIPANPAFSFNGLLRPGDRVNLLATLTDDKQASTVNLLENIMVLAVGGDMGVKLADGKRGRTITITLAVFPVQAQLITFTANSGKLSVVLRHPDDTRVNDRSPEITMKDALNVPPLVWKPGSARAKETTP